jgi:hypothetical protein
MVPGSKLVVTRIGHGARLRIAWRDEHGRAADVPLGAISPDERMRLFTEGDCPSPETHRVAAGYVA